MDLSSPLRSLFPPVAAECLDLLADPAAADGLPGREIARRVEASSAAVARSALLGLVRVGLVSREVHRHQVLYRVNREHLLWPAMEAVRSARDVFAARVRAFVEASAVPRAAVLLYGSTARGDATASSDVDLLVVFPNGEALEMRDDFSAGLSAAAQGWTGSRVEIYDLTASDLQDHVAAGEAIVASWQSEAQLLAGVRPAALGSMAA